MVGLPTPSTATLLVSIAVVTTLTGLLSGWMAFRRRNAAGGLPLAALCVTTVGWIVAYTTQLLSPTIVQKLVWVDVAWLPAALSPVCWLLFALEYSGRDRLITRDTILLLLALPLLSTALLWTNDSHGLVLAGYDVITYGTLDVIQWTYGPAFWVIIGYSYILVLTGAFIIGETAVESLEVYRLQSVALISAAITPILLSLMSVGFGVLPIDATPYAFAVSDALCVLALTQFDLLEARPVPGHLARGRVMESLADAIVVTDVRGYVTDANPAAVDVLAPETDGLVGRPIGSIHPTLSTDYDSVDAINDAEFDVNGETRYFDVQFTNLEDTAGRTAGHIVSLRDVTERRLRLQQLSVLNRVLRHDLRTRANLILGNADMAGTAVRAGDTDETLDRLGKVRENANSLVDAAEKVRYAESLLSTGTRNRPESIDDLVSHAVSQVLDTYPAVDIYDDHEDPTVHVSALAGIVVHNLVENAAEHNDADAPWVRVETEPIDDKDAIRVRITDNGPGIPEHELDVLDGEETALHHGSGVGLWLVEWCIDAIGGTVEFEDRAPETDPDATAGTPEKATESNSPARGTVVTLELPRLDLE